MSWTTLLKMELRELFRTSRMTATSSGNSQILNSKINKGLNRVLSSEIKLMDWSSWSTNLASYSMKGSSLSLPERNSWDYLTQVALIRALWAAMREEPCTAEATWALPPLPLETLGKNMEDLGQKTWISSATTTTISLETMLTIPSPKIRALPQLAVRKKRRNSQSRIVIHLTLAICLNTTVMTLTTPKRKRRRLPRKRLRRRLRNWSKRRRNKRKLKSKSRSQQNQPQPDSCLRLNQLTLRISRLLINLKFKHNHCSKLKEIKGKQV